MLIIRPSERHFIFRRIEWLLTAEIFSFGIVLSGHGSPFSTSLDYEFMARFAGSGPWGALFVGVGLIRGFILALNGTIVRFRRWSPLVRVILAVVSAVLWAFFCIGAIISPVPSFALPTYAIFFISEIVVAKWAAREAGEAERMHRTGCE